MLSLKASWRVFPCLQLLVIDGNPWRSLACRGTTPPFASVFIWCFPVCLSLCFFFAYQDSSHTGLSRPIPVTFWGCRRVMNLGGTVSNPVYLIFFSLPLYLMPNGKILKRRAGDICRTSQRPRLRSDLEGCRVNI